VNRLPRWLPITLAVAPAVLLLVFYAWPFVTLLTTAVDRQVIVDTLSSARTWRVVWFTSWQAVVSTALTLAVGIAPAYVFARYRFRGRVALLGLMTAMFVLPTVVMGAAILAVVPDSFDRTIWAVLTAHVVFNLAVVVRVTGATWERLPRDMEHAAATLGASPLATFRHVTFPILRPALLAAGSIVFVFTFTSYGVIRVLAAPGTRTIEVEVWRNATQLGRVGTAAVLAVLQLAVLAAAVTWSSRSQRRQARVVALDDAPSRRAPATTKERWIVAVVVGGTAAVTVIPLGALVLRSLSTPSGWSTAAWTRLGRVEVRPGISLGVDPVDAIRNSLGTAFWATLVAVTVGAAASLAIASSGPLGKALDSGSMLPIATSAVTIGFGMLITFDTDPVDWRGSTWLVPIGQALVALPFVVRNCVGVLRSVDPSLGDAAMTLGAAPARAWRHVVVPYLWRPLASGAALAAAISLGEFGATSFLSRSGGETMPIVIDQLLGRTGSILQAQGYVLATLLAAATIGLVATVELTMTRQRRDELSALPVAPDLLASSTRSTAMR
jgi:thiamine transport system permease protein